MLLYASPPSKCEGLLLEFTTSVKTMHMDELEHSRKKKVLMEKNEWIKLSKKKRHAVNEVEMLREKLKSCSWPFLLFNINMSPLQSTFWLLLFDINLNRQKQIKVLIFVIWPKLAGQMTKMATVTQNSLNLTNQMEIWSKICNTTLQTAFYHLSACVHRFRGTDLDHLRSFHG